MILMLALELGLRYYQPLELYFVVPVYPSYTLFKQIGAVAELKLAY
jgi:hypothetical protein